MKFYKNSQSGAASILFTMVMTVIISLLAIGFSIITSNDQRATLDKSVSSQAQYAAQTGINSVVEAIANGTIQVGTNASACTTANILPTFNVSNLKVSCLKWNFSPASLSYSNNSFSTVISPTNTLTGIKIVWGTITSKNAYTSSVNNLSSAVATNFPIIKIVLANAADVSTAKTIYVVPGSSSSVGQINTAADTSKVVTANCGSDTLTTCSFTVNLTTTQYTWDTTHSGLVSVTGLNGDVSQYSINGVVSSGSVSFNNSQVQIDSTATDNNQVQRLIASYSINGTSSWKPVFAAEVENYALCKNYEYTTANTATTAGPASSSICD